MNAQLGFTAPAPLGKFLTIAHGPLSSCQKTKCQLSPTTPQATSFQPHNDNGNVSRRYLLNTAAAMTAATLLSPLAANALSKKRILAKAGVPVTMPSGVIYREISVGKGYSPRNGDTVAIHYSLFYENLEVESSRESQGLAASPIGFTFGTKSGPGSIMSGINLGVDGMKVGGLRLISVPPELAFGEKGKMPLIPPNATVDFAISLLSCKRRGTNPNIMIDPKAQAF